MEHLIISDSPLADEAILRRGREVIRLEADALRKLEATIDQSFVTACGLIAGAKHRLVITGIGKSGHVARKLAATFAATGTPAIYLHPAEAAHGDLGMLVRGDVLLVMSNSGNTSELRAVIDYARRLAVEVIGVASRRRSFVIERATIGICLPSVREACPSNIAPTTSTTMQLALGDALAMAVMDMRGVSEGRLHSLHPAGAIGLRLTPVRDVMHGRDELPLVREFAGMPEVISTMTSGRFGLAGVLDNDGRLIGIITDGDLRRHFGEISVASAADVMTRNPKSLPAEMQAGDALLLLNDAKITAAFVFDNQAGADAAHPIGIVHIHDLLRFGLN